MSKILIALTFLALAVMTPQGAGAVEAPFTILPGDVLQISVWHEEGMDKETLVLPDGTITFPLIGTVQAGGLTPQDLQTAVKEKLTALVPDAAVTVTVRAASGHMVSVMGQVVHPGEFAMGKQMTAMQALSQAGGLTPYASEGRIIVLRKEQGKETSLPVPYKDIVRGEELDKNIVLHPGDVVVVPSSGLF